MVTPPNFNNMSTILPTLSNGSHHSSRASMDIKNLQEKLKEKDEKAKWYEDAL
jgi:hypothetical protein